MNWLAPLTQVASVMAPPICSHRHCDFSDWARWKRRRDGIVFNHRWYCGTECLEAAVAEFLAEVSAQKTDRASPHRLPLGLLMLSRGNIDQEQLRSALQSKDRTPSLRIGECLAELGAVSEVQITRALGAQNCLPVLLTRDFKVDERVPAHLQKVNDAICFHASSSKELLYVGFGVRANANLAKAIEFMSGTPVESCMTPLSFVRECLEPGLVRWRPSEVVFNHPCCKDEIASAIVSYAVQVECDQVKTVQAGEWLWAQLDGRRERMHLMFRLGPTKES